MDYFKRKHDEGENILRKLLTALMKGIVLITGVTLNENQSAKDEYRLTVFFKKKGKNSDVNQS
jgi:hypothetical protein